MPKSKSKRNHYKPPPSARPPSSPSWVPVTGAGLIGLGVVLILLTYLVRSAIPGGQFGIVIGFVMMAAGLIILSRWR
ncbi:hypothetical protein BH24ACT15_BH24ACT15_15640 [soil metagenome]